jgi:hypothetical protein
MSIAVYCNKTTGSWHVVVSTYGTVVGVLNALNGESDADLEVNNNSGEFTGSAIVGLKVNGIGAVVCTVTVTFNGS